MPDEIFRRLASGEDLATVGIPQHGGRVDLRGIAGPKPVVLSSRDRTVAGRVFREDRLGNAPHVTGTRLSGIDFSYANLSDLNFTETVIEDCVFDNARMQDVGFWGCRVDRDSFRGSDLRGAVLGGRWKAATAYRDVSFVDSDLRNCNPGIADFFGCDFSNARLDKIEFYGNSFVSCRFAGPLRDVAFSSLGLSGDNRSGSFESVDLSGAELHLCTFRGISLEQADLPQGPGHVIFEAYACAVGRALEELHGVTTTDGRWLATILEIHAERMLPAQRRGVIGVADLHPDETYEAGEQAADWLRAIDRDCVLRRSQPVR